MIDGHCVRTLHAEQNALIQAALHGVGTAGATAYVTHQPCLTCAKMLINAGVRRVVYAGNYPDEISRDFLRQAGITLDHITRPRSGDTVYQPSLLVPGDPSAGDPSAGALSALDPAPQPGR
jgi:dCMP deaminase